MSCRKEGMSISNDISHSQRFSLSTAATRTGKASISCGIAALVVVLVLLVLTLLTLWVVTSESSAFGAAAAVVVRLIAQVHGIRDLQTRRGFRVIVVVVVVVVVRRFGGHGAGECSFGWW
jgi:hypothetical protein